MASKIQRLAGRSMKDGCYWPQSDGKELQLHESSAFSI